MQNTQKTFTTCEHCDRAKNCVNSNGGSLCLDYNGYVAGGPRIAVKSMLVHRPASYESSNIARHMLAEKLTDTASDPVIVTATEVLPGPGSQTTSKRRLTVAIRKSTETRPAEARTAIDKLIQIDGLKTLVWSPSRYLWVEMKRPEDNEGLMSIDTLRSILNLNEKAISSHA